MKHVYWLLLLTLLWSTCPALAGEPLACLQDWAPAVETRMVGVERIHGNHGKSQVSSLPLPLSPQNGFVGDLNALDFDSGLPPYSTMSDATVFTAFFSIDLRPGSRLNRCITELADRLRAKTLESGDPLPLLATFINEYLGMVPEGFKFPWDPQNQVALPPEWYQAGSLPPGHAPLNTQLVHPSVPLESFLYAQRGLCLQKAILTSLIMKELGIRHRVRAGGSEFTGHTWIELSDGRILDPTWQLLTMPTSAGALPGWFRLDQSFMYQLQYYPFAIN